MNVKGRYERQRKNALDMIVRDMMARRKDEYHMDIQEPA
jgi:hypothetical protein